MKWDRVFVSSDSEEDDECMAVAESTPLPHLGMRMLRPRFKPIANATHRPAEHDVLLASNKLVYASRAFIAGEWNQNGLFAASTLKAHDVIDQYTGPHVGRKARAQEAQHSYLMAARSTTKESVSYTINGRPTTKNPNLPGYANYSTWPNARFVDDCSFSLSDKHNKETNVLLVASEEILPGCEIRVNYDGDDADASFRQMLLGMGVAPIDLDNNAYKLVQWEYPTAFLGRLGMNHHVG